MKFILTLTMLFSASAFAEINSVDGSIEKMVKENVISEAEAIKLKRKSSWKKFEKADLRVASRGPASVDSNVIEEVPGKDLDVAQFKAIQNEMKRILHR